ncbi:hypothetical protein ASE74_12330 [Pedobacter sp. Leaf216]|uniref:glycosyltransferase family 2 protein n=1 Tax=Pedobacter sp. Leaf216 TaxID=1735684 RepID=UPI0006F92C69|nr:glycosyltransferase [Pedobacter sp. Leaf216]KQM63947.1 hypothetical protein ASE74_12330 [Pedobacter sp. Leaf216]
MHSSPTISLLIPVFNGEKYIIEFCEHLKNQELKFDEVIFYNDGSTDNSLSLLKKSGYKYFSSAFNKGVGFARNVLARASNSNYIHFHDVDDKFDKSFIYEINKAITGTKADVIFGNSDWVDENSKKVVIEWRYNQAKLAEDPTNYFLSNPLGIINTVYNKNAFLNINGFNERLHCWEDADIHIRLAIAGNTFAHINCTIAISIRHNKGLSNDQIWCWDCRLNFLETYIRDYNKYLNMSVVESEIKKVQNVFIKSGNFYKLQKILSLKKVYQLHIRTEKIYALYLLNKLIPSKLLLILIKRIKI